MATYRNRNGRWNALVKVNDNQISKTFDTKTEAKVWALGIERDLKIDSGKARPTVTTENGGDTFGRLLRTYRRQVTPTKSQARDEESLINRLLNEPFTEVALGELKMEDLTSFRDKRLFEDGVSPATVDRDFRVIKAVANYAKQSGKAIANLDLFSSVKLPRTIERPVRRITDEQFDGLLWACKPSNPRRTDNALYMAPLLQLALATGMRQGELCSLEWWMVDRTASAITLPSAITKTAKQRIIPITGRAEEALDALQGLYGASGKVLGDVTQTAVELAWKRVKARSDINVRFHDLRHESISRFFEMGCTIPEVMTISGHKTVAALDIYTHANTSSLIARLKGV